VYKVIIDPRRRWHWDADCRMYVEERVELGEEKPWFAEAAEALLAPHSKVQFPPRCPHCAGTPTTTRAFTTWRHYSKRVAFAFEYRPAVVTMEVPSCARMARDLPSHFLQIFLAFVTVVATLAILTSPYAAVVALGGLAASIALWRARTWIRVPNVIDDVITIESRDAAYAHALARLNHGRVEGRGPVPELPPGDERRAPLPTAIVKK
jgi:hypothetical protein